MFKKLFNKPKDKNEQERSTTREKQGQVNSSNGFEEIPERPFDINLDELWEYEFEELHEFIKHYEQFCNYVRNKYNDLLNESLFVQEKLGLLDQERRRLVTENEQYKVHIENLKRCLDEKSPSATTVEALTTKSSSQKTEEAPLSPTGSDQNEDDAVLALKNRAEKLLEELKIAQEPICHNIIGLLAEHSHLDNKKSDQIHHTEEGEEKEHEDKSEEGHGSRALDTENNEALDFERVNADGATERESKEAFEAHLREAVFSSLGSAFKRISKEVGNIFEGYSEVYGKTRQKEKDMIAKIKNEVASKAKNEEYEKELKDLRGKLNEAKNAMNEMKTELDNKTKLLEKAKKTNDDTLEGIAVERKQYEKLINEHQKEIEELSEAVEEFKETILKDEKAIEELEAERDELQSKLEEIEKEYQLLTKNKDKNEKDVAQEVQKYQKNLQLIEEEKKKNEKKLQRIEADRNDIENSLIQEKLKHHQTIADLTKAKEKIEEVQKNLNEETDARKGDIRKYDDLKKRMTELEKKEKENKKTIKSLNEQLESKNKEIQHLEEERQKHLELNKANTDKGSEQDNHEDGVHHEVLQKAGIINTQYEKIHQLEEKLEEAVKQMNITQKNAQQLQKDKDELATQVKVLKEKRELGLQEIKRLTKLVDQSKAGDGNMSLSSVQSRTNIDFEKPGGGYFSPVTITSPNSLSSSRLNLEPENIKNLRKIKKGLDEVYKEIIMAITNEKLYESQSDKKATGKFGELVKGPLPSDNFMKIEKRMNDTIVMLQEFMENFE